MNEGEMILSGMYDDSNLKAQIRTLLNQGSIDEALNLANQLPESDSDYYFLQAWGFLEKGWLQRAKDYLQIAMQMDPGNGEYQALWQRMNNPGRSYKAQSAQQGYTRSPGCCELGSCLCCTDCCCESMGGDFITCC